MGVATLLPSLLRLPPWLGLTKPPPGGASVDWLFCKVELWTLDMAMGDDVDDSVSAYPSRWWYRFKEGPNLLWLCESQNRNYVPGFVYSVSTNVREFRLRNGYLPYLGYSLGLFHQQNN